MNEISNPDPLPSWVREWVKEHVALYLQDGEAGHYWDASLASRLKLSDARQYQSERW